MTVGAVARAIAGALALLPMLVLLEEAQAGSGELMNEAAINMIEQLLVLAAQELAAAKCRGRTRGPVLLQPATTTIKEPSSETSWSWSLEIQGLDLVPGA